MDNQQNNNIPSIPQIHPFPNANIPPPPFPNPLFYQQEVNQPKNIDSLNDPSAQITPESNNEEHKKRKRATKKESDIRNFKCTQCDKSYLSYPALYTHCKQKHNTNNHSGRNRGRPKKETNEVTSDKNLYDPLTPAFFQREDRTGSTPPEKINECIKNAFIFIYETNKESVSSKKMREYNNIEEHTFLGNYLKDEHKIDLEIEDEKTPTDKVLMDYLNKTSTICNENYFEKLIIFVTLFRESVNLINKLEGNQEYTMVKEAEDVPDRSNDFITDFLFPDDQETSFGFDKDESIDLTRNLCNWMYTHNFTCSKLFLI